MSVGFLIWLVATNAVRLVDGLPCERLGVGIVSVRAEAERCHGLCDYALEGDELAARVMAVMAGWRECRPNAGGDGDDWMEPRLEL